MIIIIIIITIILYLMSGMMISGHGLTWTYNRNSNRIPYLSNPMYESIPHFGAKKIRFFFFWVKIFLQNLSFILEFRYAMVT